MGCSLLFSPLAFFLLDLEAEKPDLGATDLAGSEA